MIRSLALAILLTTTALAQESYSYSDGNKLLEMCDSTSASDQAFCAGYVAAAMDGQVTLVNSLGRAATKPNKPAHMYCLPNDGIKLGQAERVTVKWLQDHPEKLHLAGDVLVGMALQDGFPCK